MASFISNCAGSFANPVLTGTGTNFALDLASSTSWFNNTPNINLSSVVASSNYASGSFYNGGSFQMYGSGFTTSYTPTVTDFIIHTPDTWIYDYYGNVSIDLRTGSASGSINHIVIKSPKGESIDVIGAIYTNSYDGSISSITYKFSDGVIAVKGALIYHGLTQTVTGTLTSFAFTDNSGHKYQLTGISVQYQQLNAYNNLDSFVAGVMSGNDVMTGTAGADVLRGFGGNDALNGGVGADKMFGGVGNDTYYVDNVGDVVTETNALANVGGTDIVYSYLTAYTLGTNVENGRILATGIAKMTGNTLNNVIYAGNGVNSIDGLGGTDTLSYQFSTTTALLGVTLNLSVLNGSGQATAGGISGADLIKGIENIIGSNYNDTLTGNVGVNVLNGLAGDDTINGGAGNDILIGGAGKDTLIGGLANDAFDFNAYSELGLGATRDVITDFIRGQDKIDLSTIDSNAALAGNQAFSLITAAFTTAGQIRYSAGIIAINTDADAAVEFEIQLTGVIPATLTATDFML